MWRGAQHHKCEPAKAHSLDQRQSVVCERQAKHRWRMSRDVLADGAAQHLKKLRFD